MVYSTEHLILALLVGYIVGVTSTLFLSKKGLTVERQVSLFIMTMWVGMTTYGFVTGENVPLLFDFAGFGATGTFIGLKLSDVKDKIPVKWR